MLAEYARVVAREPGVLWVETMAQSACGSCAGNAECGTGLLQKYLQTTQYLQIRIREDEEQRYQIGDELELGLDEGVMVRGSMMVYLMPLAGLIAGAGIGYPLGGDLASVALGILGMVVVGAGIRRHSARNRFNPNYHPVILDQSAILSRS